MKYDELYLFHPTEMAKFLLALNPFFLANIYSSFSLIVWAFMIWRVKRSWTFDTLEPLPLALLCDSCCS